MPQMDSDAGRPAPASGKPGWYYTRGAHDQSYWDGEAWSEHRHLVDGDWVEGSDPSPPEQPRVEREEHAARATSSSSRSEPASATPEASRPRAGEPATRKPRRRPSKARRRFTGFLWLLVLAACVFGAIVGIKDYRDRQHTSSSSAVLPVTAVYSVTGSGPAILQWNTPQGSYNDPLALTPWTLNVSTTGSFVYRISAAPVDNGTATCSISVGGQVLSTQTSHQTDSPAICLGYAPIG